MAKEELEAYKTVIDVKGYLQNRYDVLIELEWQAYKRNKSKRLKK